MKRLLFRFLPRSIFWRLAGLTAFTLVLSTAFVVALFNFNRIHMVTSALAEQSVDLLANAEEQLDALTPDQQIEWLIRNERPYAMHLTTIDSIHAPSPTMLPRSYITRTLADTIRKKVAGVGDVRETAPPRRQLWVQVDMLGRPMWMVIPLGRVHHDPVWQFGAAAGFFMLAALAMSALFAWKINRPLRELRAAANKLGRGERPAPLPERGPLEVKELSASFNRMLTDLDTHERERDVMLAGISHDLRTPLARLRLGVEMMRDASLQDGMREDVDDIERILGQFIAYSRGLGGEDMATADPGELARSIAGRYAREHCDIQLDIGDDVPLLECRPLALSRAIANLIDNARRYGQPPLTLRVAKSNHHILFEVSDHGPGIPPGQLADALKPFHRLDSARTADGGSGLGFAIVERIARLHGGSLRLSNRASGGLIASLHIPLAGGE